MGDRCYYRAEVRREDLLRFMKILVQETYESVEAYLKVYKYTNDAPFIEVEFEEINYGGWMQTEEAAAAGLVFHGFHGAGGDYAACSFVAFNDKLYHVVDLDGPIVSVHSVVDEEGQAAITIDPDDLARVKAYEEAWWRFKKLFPDSTQG